MYPAADDTGGQGCKDQKRGAPQVDDGDVISEGAP
jgi:hypothetical protein